MADTKISALPAATTPLAGTEVLPVVQSSTTKKVSVSDLTTGRAVSAASLTLTSSPLAVTSGGSGTATAFTQGSVIFAGASGVYSQNNSNLFWDNTNNRLGVGTAAPATSLDVYGTGNTTLRVSGSSGGGSSVSQIDFFRIGSAVTSSIVAIRDGSNDSGALTFFTAASGSNTEKARITTSGYFVVGNTSAAGTSQITAYGTSNGQIAVQNSTNYSRFLQNSNDLYVDNGVGGTGGSVIFRNGSGTTERARVDNNGNVQVGTAALATTATNGFFYIPTCAGAPTGVPTAKTGLVPMIYDSTNNNFYIYNGGWKKVTLA